APPSNHSHSSIASATSNVIFIDSSDMTANSTATRNTAAKPWIRLWIPRSIWVISSVSACKTFERRRPTMRPQSAAHRASNRRRRSAPAKPNCICATKYSRSPTMRERIPMAITHTSSAAATGDTCQEARIGSERAQMPLCVGPPSSPSSCSSVTVPRPSSNAANSAVSTVSASNLGAERRTGLRLLRRMCQGILTRRFREMNGRLEHLIRLVGTPKTVLAGDQLPPSLSQLALPLLGPDARSHRLPGGHLLMQQIAHLAVERGAVAAMEHHREIVALVPVRLVAELLA